MAEASDERIAQGRGRAARGHSARHQGPVLHRGRRLDRRAPTSSKSFKPPYESTVTQQSLERRRGDARQAQHGRVRHGLVERDERLRPRRVALAAPRLERRRRRRRAPSRARISCRAAPRAARRRRSRRGSASARRRPTPAARSASRRRSRARSASSRPTGAARAGASSPSRRPSTRPGRSPARCATPPSCCARWPGHDPKDTTSADMPVPDFEAAVVARRQGPEDRHSEGIPHRRHAGGDRDALAAGRRVAAGAGRRDRRGLAAAHEIRAAGLLHRGAGRGLLEPRPLRRRPLRPARARPGHRRACTRRPAPKASAAR